MTKLAQWIRVAWAFATLHWIGVVGAITACFAFVLFWVLLISDMVGLLQNPYIGILTYLILPGAFLAGVVLVPIGLWFYHRRTGIEYREMFSVTFLEEHGGGAQSHRAFPLILVMSFVNLAFWGFGASTGFHYLEQPEFCGTSCHPVMKPEWTVYQSSPHANVSCADCHIGHTIAGKLATKLNGAYQIYSHTFNKYERPIPTPVTTLRPAHETCQECHHQDYRQTKTFRTRVHYGTDVNNTPYYNTLMMKLTASTEPRRVGIHNHATKTSTTTYMHSDEKRMNILWTRQEKADGKIVEYVRRGMDKHVIEEEAEFPEREMDCTDCHNRVSHVYEDPVKAIEKRMYDGEIKDDIPFIRARAEKLLTKPYATVEEAAERIPHLLTKYYETSYPELWAQREADIRAAADSLVATYQRNVFPEMNIGWNTYPSMSTHEGCWRCHNDDLVDEQGVSLSYECTHCHSILSFNGDGPYEAFTADEDHPEHMMYSYLKEEFLEHSQIR